MGMIGEMTQEEADLIEWEIYASTLGAEMADKIVGYRPDKNANDSDKEADHL